MRLFERIMRRLGWVPVGLFKASQQNSNFWRQSYWETLSAWDEDSRKRKGNGGEEVSDEAV